MLMYSNFSKNQIISVIIAEKGMDLKGGPERYFNFDKNSALYK